MALTSGQLAKKCQVGVETLRFYEREGLLAKPARTQSGYRQYPAEAVERVRFIRRAQLLGFQLKDIKELLALRHRPKDQGSGSDEGRTDAADRHV
jgi:DNA-binding transcriptional MerR regulator